MKSKLAGVAVIEFESYAVVGEVIGLGDFDSVVHLNSLSQQIWFLSSEEDTEFKSRSKR